MLLIFALVVLWGLAAQGGRVFSGAISGSSHSCEQAPRARAATATDTRTSKGRAPGAMTKARDQSGQEGCCGELYNPYCIKRWDCRWGSEEGTQFPEG